MAFSPAKGRLNMATERMPYCKLLIINVYKTAVVHGRTILIQLLGEYDTSVFFRSTCSGKFKKGLSNLRFTSPSWWRPYRISVSKKYLGNSKVTYTFG